MQGDQLQKTKVSYDSKASTVQMLINNYKVTLHFQADAPSKCLWHFLFEAWAAESANASAMTKKTGEE